MKASDLTPAQRGYLLALVHKYRKQLDIDLSGYVPTAGIGEVACRKLERKGLAYRLDTYGPRGGIKPLYKPTHEGLLLADHISVNRLKVS